MPIFDYGIGGQACTPQYFEFAHHYTCSQNEAKDISTLNLTPAELSAIKVINPQASKVCAFTPKVQVLDNWGWCNGDCQGAGKGCYNDEGNNEEQCDNLNAAWTLYKGKIIVVPK